MEVFLLTLICVVTAGIIFFGGRSLLLAGSSLGREKSLILKFQSFRNYLNPGNLLPLVILVLIFDLLFLVETIFIIRALYYLFLLLILFFLGNLAKLLIWDNREKIEDFLSLPSNKLIFVSFVYVFIFFLVGAYYILFRLEPLDTASESFSIEVGDNEAKYSAKNQNTLNMSSDSIISEKKERLLERYKRILRLEMYKSRYEKKESKSKVGREYPLRYEKNPKKTVPRSEINNSKGNVNDDIVKIEGFKFSDISCSELGEGFICFVNVEAGKEFPPFKTNTSKTYAIDEKGMEFQATGLEIEEQKSTSAIISARFKGRTATDKIVKIEFEFVIGGKVFTVLFKNVKID
jgi:hypothetical protein